ncbi:hypothetical protein D3C86_1949830 [compost metagenome]
MPLGVDLIVHGVGDGAGLLATAFVDETVEAQGQDGSGWRTADVEAQSGLLAPVGQRDAADLTGILPCGIKVDEDPMV